MKPRALFVFCISILLFSACTALAGGDAPAPPATEPPPVDEAPTQPTEAPEHPAIPVETEAPRDEPPMPFELTSTAFSQGGSIPVKYSCDGDDISPPLAWGKPPEGTQSQVLIMDDPDAPVSTWDHWILFNIPANTYGLEESLPITGLNPGSISVAKNSWGRNDYGGPCPPGGTHRYFFKLYALDTTLPSDGNMDKTQLLAAMDGHILAETELMGTFSR